MLYCHVVSEFLGVKHTHTQYLFNVTRANTLKVKSGNTRNQMMQVKTIYFKNVAIIPEYYFI